MRVELPQPARLSTRDYQPILLEGTRLQNNGSLFPSYKGKPETLRMYIDTETGILVADVEKYEQNLKGVDQ